VVFQFGSTVVIMVCMVAVYLQLNFLRSADLGMDLNQTLVIRAPLLEVSDSLANVQYQRAKIALGKSAEVQKVSTSETVPGLSLHELSTTSNVKRVGHEKEGGGYNYYHFAVDAAFISTMEMELAAGRDFEAGGENFDQVIINEEAVKRLGFSSTEEALGAKITFRTRWEGEPAEIIGVLNDFHQRSPKEQQIPMILRYSEGAGYFSVKLSTTNMQEAVASVKRVWDGVFPNSVFHYFFLDEKYDQQYQADARFGHVVATFSGLTVFIACLGLFGLSSFTIIQRTKEIGIRKVLGASVLQIVRLLSKDFARVVLTAALLALPLAYYAIELWLSGYASRIQLSAWIFIVPVFFIVAIAMVTVSFQTIKTALKNPSTSLKQE
jgi:putative ABC transport system permease protein